MGSLQPLALTQSPPRKSQVVSGTRVTSRPGSTRNGLCWSKLPVDLLQLVFERLGFTDFERAKCVCSSWHAGSRISQPNNKTPWVIQFPERKNYCLLLCPEDKGKLYKTRSLGNKFAKSSCVATFGSRLLMRPKSVYKGCQRNLYIVDILTGKRINLPNFASNRKICDPILWMDEKTKDYLVIGRIDPDKMVSFKNGDNAWKEVPQVSTFFIHEFRMVYKDHKLHCLNNYKIRIFDFSGETPMQVFKMSARRLLQIQGLLLIRGLSAPRRHTHMIVTVGGDVLIVKSTHYEIPREWVFRIFKIDSSKKTKWNQIDSLDGESIILDLGITVLAKDLQGIPSNSIYFSYKYEYGENEIFIYNLDTNKVEQQLPPSAQISNARWFIPCFKRE